MSEQPEFYIPESALVIVAHADDIEFGASGLVARWTDAGAKVTYCIVTDNGAGSNDPNTNLAELIATRKAEQIASAKIVGVDDVRFLNHRDGVLQPTLDLRCELTKLIREVRPQVVILMDPTMVIAATEAFTYINHPDHRAAGEAALYAVFPSAGSRPIFPELLAQGYEPHNVKKAYLMLSEQSNLIVDIGAVYERKLDALRCHKSQIKEEDFEFIHQWSAEIGKPLGYERAEAYRVLNLSE